MSFTQHFAAISQVFSDCMHICSFQQCQYCEIGNVSMGFSKSLMPKILYKSLVFDSWFDKIFGICDLENPILTFPPHSIVSLLSQAQLPLARDNWYVCTRKGFSNNMYIGVMYGLLRTLRRKRNPNGSFCSWYLLAPVAKVIIHMLRGEQATIEYVS